MPDLIYKADVVIIRAGLAGIAAALEMLDHNRSVVLIDRANETKFGGLARISFGAILIVGSPEQKPAGIKDNPDLALRDWIRSDTASSMLMPYGRAAGPRRTLAALLTWFEVGFTAME